MYLSGAISLYRATNLIHPIFTTSFIRKDSGSAVERGEGTDGTFGHIGKGENLYAYGGRGIRTKPQTPRRICKRKKRTVTDGVKEAGH